MTEAIELRDLDKIIRSLHELAPQVEREVKDEMRLVGGAVRDEAASLFEKYSDRADFRVYVRAAGLVQVEEAKRKTTGKHPEFGALQMTKALLPARDAKLEKAASGLELRIGRVMSRHGL